MLSFVRVRRLALLVCISLACIAIGNTSSRAAHQSYITIKGQKQGSFKGGSVKGRNPNPNGHRNVHPVITHVQTK